MTIDTIKDVLGRILTINKNLTAESLKTLLDASGWDANDIQEGMRIYSDYVAAGGNMSKVSAQASPEIINNSINGMESVSRMSSKEMTPSFVQNGIIDLSQEKLEPVKKYEEARILNNVDMSDASTQEVKMPEIMKTQESISMPIGQDNYSMSHDLHAIEEYITQQKPWGLIIFNSILFIMTLSLLVYILLN